MQLVKCFDTTEQKPQMQDPNLTRITIICLGRLVQAQLQSFRSNHRAGQ